MSTSWQLEKLGVAAVDCRLLGSGSGSGCWLLAGVNRFPPAVEPELQEEGSQQAIPCQEDRPQNQAKPVRSRKRFGKKGWERLGTRVTDNAGITFIIASLGLSGRSNPKLMSQGMSPAPMPVLS